VDGKSPPTKPREEARKADDNTKCAHPFDAEVNDSVNEELLKADSDFQALAAKHGMTDRYESEGGASLASVQSEIACSNNAKTRIFLKPVDWEPADIFQEGSLWIILEREHWLPISPSFSYSAEPSPLPLDEAEWEFCEKQASAAATRRDLVGLNELIEATANPLFKQLIRGIAWNVHGQIGDAYYLITSLEQHGLIRSLPDSIKFDVLRQAASVYSLAGHSDRSLALYSDLRATLKYGKMTDVQRVGVLRNELNHCLQTAQSSDLYYDPSGPVLTRFDSILRECLKYVGSDLDAACRFDPVTGPGIICMKEYREWIHYSKVNRAAANEALDRQLSSIEKLCERDHRLGPIRFSPLIGQHIRTRNWEEAKHILSRQRESWESFDPSPETNNMLEYAIHRILHGIVSAFGFGNLDESYKDWKAAKHSLANTKTLRFQAVIDELFLATGKDGGLSVDSTQVAGLNRRLAGQPVGSDYYFFGRD